jgi:hypothetical protein
MARNTKPNITKQPSATVTKTKAASNIAYATRGLIDVQGDGVLSDLAIGWNGYSHPTLVADREANYQRRENAFVAAKRAALAK